MRAGRGPPAHCLTGSSKYGLRNPEERPQVRMRSVFSSFQVGGRPYASGERWLQGFFCIAVDSLGDATPFRWSAGHSGSIPVRMRRRTV